MIEKINLTEKDLIAASKVFTEERDKALEQITKTSRPIKGFDMSTNMIDPKYLMGAPHYPYEDLYARYKSALTISIEVGAYGSGRGEIQYANQRHHLELRGNSVQSGIIDAFSQILYLIAQVDERLKVEKENRQKKENTPTRPKEADEALGYVVDILERIQAGEELDTDELEKQIVHFTKQLNE